ncbi:atp-dependent dna helicase q5 [Limosa lapponica baueri]|uniref:Atp-dependent dna helicase q5 n=1 Tax=Limosa lapponica baueri TaxID=1758121 RepID=A0A2I0TWP9_LIMLA|nr:atp-dependent dna helicase q5 [Limosa lapponica baueri]
MFSVSPSRAMTPFPNVSCVVGADCPLKDAFSRRISKLTVKGREHCLKMLEEALSTNQNVPAEGKSVAENVAETELTVVGEGDCGKRPGSDEDMESPATKRLRTVAKSSILSQPESKSVCPTKKKFCLPFNLSGDALSVLTSPIVAPRLPTLLQHLLVTPKAIFAPCASPTVCNTEGKAAVKTG